MPERDSDGRIPMKPLPSIQDEYSRKLAELTNLIRDTQAQAWARAYRETYPQVTR
jgi:hypothetical protein